MDKFDQTGGYHPTKDPHAYSHVAVAYIKGSPGSEADCGFVEVLATAGCGWDYAVENDEMSVLEGLAEYIASSWPGYESGVYILTCQWIGSGEDTEYIVAAGSTLTEEERLQVIENRSFEGLTPYWYEERWAQVPCKECGQKPGKHTGLEMACPKVPDEP